MITINKGSIKTVTANHHLYTVGSLFAGMGGFSRAFMNAGFRILWANENDSFALKTYEYNFPDVLIYNQPIEELSVVKDALEPVDILTAGFPCQPFSVAGDKRGFKDPRGRLFFEIIRLCKEFGNQAPKILVLENVKNLLYHNHGRTFNKLVDEIQSAGYWFTPKNAAVLNTKDVTEIPHNRERLFMIAFSWHYFKSNNFSFPEQVEALKDVRDYLDLDKPADSEYYFEKDSKYGKLFNSSMEEGDPNSIYLLRRWYVRENKNKCVFTLTANMGEGGHNVPVIKDNWGIRKLTPEECLRLQGFKNCELLFHSDLSKTQKYKQIGNTVTVELVRKIALKCNAYLNLARGELK